MALKFILQGKGLNLLKFIILFLAPNFTIAQNLEPIVIPIHKTVSIVIPTPAVIHNLNSQILKVKESGHELLLTGKSLGSTQLKINKNIHPVFVVSESQSNAFNQIKNKVQSMEGLELIMTEAGPAVQGELLRFTDWLGLSNTKIPHMWLMKAKLNTRLKDEALKYFSQYLLDKKIVGGTLLFEPNPTVFLSNSDEKIKKQFEELFFGYGFEIKINTNQLDLQPMIETHIQITELKKSNFKAFGIDFPKQVAFEMDQAHRVNLNSDQLTTTLQAMVADGSVKILASPRLLCRSGQDAQFLAGGEFPIKIMTTRIHEVQWKKHGLILKIKPLADLSGRMSISVNAEISLLDESQAVDGIPGLLVNRVETHIDLLNSKTIALSGLIKQQWGKSRTGLPLLADIPILGALFSSQNYREDRTELVIFLTPSIISESSQNNFSEVTHDTL